jgi:hypothetical protein
MKKNALITFILTCFLCLAGSETPAFAARAGCDSFRCPGSTKAVFLGDSDDEVLRKCGDPTSVRKEGPRFLGYFSNDPAWSGYEGADRPWVYVEEWTYNFGRTRFIYYLRFRDGTLSSIEQGGYGY